MDQKIYTTKDLKLSALILTELPGSYFEILPDQLPSPFITFKISYPASAQSALDRLINDFLSKTARVDVFLYNRALRFLRNAIAANKKGGPNAEAFFK